MHGGLREDPPHQFSPQQLSPRKNSSDAFTTEFQYLSPAVHKIEINARLNYENAGNGSLPSLLGGDKIHVQEVNIDESHHKESILLHQSIGQTSNSSRLQLSDKKM